MAKLLIVGFLYFNVNYVADFDYTKRIDRAMIAHPASAAFRRPQRAQSRHRLSRFSSSTTRTELEETCLFATVKQRRVYLELRLEQLYIPVTLPTPLSCTRWRSPPTTIISRTRRISNNRPK